MVKKEDAGRLVEFFKAIERAEVWAYVGTTSTHSAYTAKINKKEVMWLKLMFSDLVVAKLKK
jgi:hypothetical protein